MALRRAEFLGALGLVAACAGAGVAAIGERRRPQVAYPSVALLDQNGAARSLSAFRGRIVVLDFMYTACGDICPLKTAQLVRVQAALSANVRARVQFVSISVDPEHDDPAALRAYAERAGVDASDWSLLTGELDSVATIVRAFDTNGGARVGTDAGPADHIGLVWVLDRQGRVVRRRTAEPLDEAALAQEVTALAGS